MELRRRRFRQEFKDNAVRQVVERGKSAAEVARALGIRADQVRRWKGLALTAPMGTVRSARRDELARLRREIRRLRGELAILERAAAVLSKDHLTVP
jgi:transposase